MNRRIIQTSILSFICPLLFSLVPAVAQVSPVKNAGNITGVKIQDQQVTVKTDHAYARIAVYNANVIRVRVDKQLLGPDFSFAVVARPRKTRVNISQTNAEITIETDSLKVRIQKKPFSIAFYTPDGQVINEDETGLGVSWVNESVTNYKKMQTGERFIGLGEKTGNLDRRGNGYTNWNTDAFAYAADQDPIYSTIPFYIGIHHTLNYGIFMDNTYQSDFNFGASNNRFSSFGARGGEMNYYFIYKKKVADIITAYTALTGRMKMPPLWSLGYQQNRYSYYPETEVLRIAQTLREKKIPADGITLDIHYMDQYKVFTWDKDRFPDPGRMTDKLRELGFKLTVIVDPGIKAEKGYGVYERGMKENIFVKYPDSTDYTGQVWPGWCHFPDFTSSKARKWWAGEFKRYGEDGVRGIWNDMNEIATWGNKMPDNLIFDYEGKKVSHLQARNVYALEMARASYEGGKEAFKKRPFVLTRSGYAGLQRYSAIWTGDNRSESSHMLAGIRLLNSLGLSGVPFTGMDIGGFTGNPNAALFAGWMQIGAFTPYFRNHTAINSKSAEPWSFGEEVLEISRNYINLRYQLMPYLYSAFYGATQDGNPLMRSLAIDYTFDPHIYDVPYQNQYLFGPAFLVVPFEPAEFGKIYFPAGKWYDLYTGEVQQGSQEKIIQLSAHKLPVYVKESSIIPMQSLVQSTAQQPADTLFLHIYQGTIANSYVYYEDDGESYDYENGSYFKRLINYDPVKGTLTFEKTEGTLKSKFNLVKLMLHGFSDRQITINGKHIAFTKDFISFITPISNFNPQGVENPVEGMPVESLVVKPDQNQLIIYL